MKTQTKEKGRTASPSKLACAPYPETAHAIRSRPAPIVPQNKMNRSIILSTTPACRSGSL